MKRGAITALQLFVVICFVVSFSVTTNASSFVLGKQYLLKQKRQMGSLVWYAVTFDRSLTGGLKLTLKVYSDRGKSLEYLDEFRDFVAPEIAERCISKFSLTEYRTEFDSSKRAVLGFQIKSIGDINYLPIKVVYENGFEDYLVRIRVRGGKFALSSKPLQQGMLKTPEADAFEKYQASKEKEKQAEAKKQAAKKAKEEEAQRKAEEKLRAEEEARRKEAPNIIINDELFDTSSDENVDKLMKESDTLIQEKEEKASELIIPPSDPVKEQKSNDALDAIINTDIDSMSGSLDASEEPVVKDVENNNSVEATEGVEATEDAVDKALNAPESAPVLEIKDEELKEDEFKPEQNQLDEEEIEIEGFDEALKEIERLENSESKK